jgi:hypothetical protein
MTRDEINVALDEKGIDRISICDARNDVKGCWYVNLHQRGAGNYPRGYYGEGPDPITALENAIQELLDRRKGFRTVTP